MTKRRIIYAKVSKRRISRGNIAYGDLYAILVCGYQERDFSKYIGFGRSAYDDF